MISQFMLRYKSLFLILLLSFVFSKKNTLTLLSPNGGEVLSTSTTLQIQWRGTADKSNFVRIFFSTDNGLNWEEIGFSQDKGTFVWQTPNRGYKDCLLKIQNFKDPKIFDISDKVFSIKGPTIKVLSPTNGDNLESRGTFDVIWETSDLTSSSVRIYYSFDNGINWELMVNKVKDVGSYSWRIPDIYGTINECVIRVEEFGNPKLNDKSIGTFNIIGVKPSIEILSPLPGELISANIDHEIIWKSKHLKSQFVKLYFSINGGASWKKLSSLIPDEGKFIWPTPDITSQICLIKIEDAGDRNISILTDDFFTVTKNPNIDLINPLGGMSIDPMEPFLIEWKSMNLSSDKVNIYYTINNKINWKSIAYQVLDSMSYIWEVPEYNIDQNQCFIKVEDVGDSDVFDENDSEFIIEGVPTIELLFPVGEELFPANTTQKIEWRTSNLKQNYVKILYSTRNGMFWEVISDSVPDYGFFNWEIPELNSKEGKIRITSVVNDNIKDENEKVFELNANPLTVFKAPLAGSQWMPYATQLIRWESYNMPSDYINIYLSKDNGTTYEFLAENLKNGGAYPLTTPEILNNNNNIIIKIEDYNDRKVNQMSDKFSIIAAPRFEINYPSGGEIHVTGSKVPIKWNSFNDPGKYINLYYSLDENDNWEKIKTDVKNTGEYIWQTPLVTQTVENFKVKIRDSYNLKNFSVSNDFTIKIPDPKITIFKPMVDETISSGKPFVIEWESISLSKDGINLYYSIDDGMNWEEIGEYFPNNGIYKWDVPKLDEISEKSKIMIQDAGKHQVVEISESFVIDGYPELFLDVPFIGQKITNGAEHSINWNYKNLNGRLVNLFYSVDKGKQWTEIVKDFPIEEKFLWTVPNLEKTKNRCRIKIQIADNESIFDQINKNFTIKVLKSSISITSKIGGEKLSGGDTLKISWTGKDLSDQGIKLLYSTDGGNNFKKIKDRMPNKGSYDWIIPRLNKTFKNCVIKIEDSGNNTIFKKSNQKFTIKPPSKIRITTPNGREKIKTKTGVYIAWDGTKMQGELVNIYYSLDNGKNWETIKDGAKNNGSMIWKVPDKKSRNCLVKVENASDKSDFDISNRTFIIR